MTEGVSAHRVAHACVSITSIVSSLGNEGEAFDLRAGMVIRKDLLGISAILIRLRFLMVEHSIHTDDPAVRRRGVPTAGRAPHFGNWPAPRLIRSGRRLQIDFEQSLSLSYTEIRAPLKVDIHRIGKEVDTLL